MDGEGARAEKVVKLECSKLECENLENQSICRVISGEQSGWILFPKVDIYGDFDGNVRKPWERLTFYFAFLWYLLK